MARNISSAPEWLCLSAFCPIAGSRSGGFFLANGPAVNQRWGEKRVALVVGNRVTSRSATAQSIARRERGREDVPRRGFDSVDVRIKSAISNSRRDPEFEATADQADIAVVYYAGHGRRSAGPMIYPIDARPASDRDAEDEAIRSNAWCPRPRR